MEGDCVSAETADPAQCEECRNMPGYRYAVLCLSNRCGERSSRRENLKVKGRTSDVSRERCGNIVQGDL